MPKRTITLSRTGEKAKSRFLAAASHDLRQPLQALAMFTAVLADRNHDPALTGLIGRIQDSVVALEDLLGSLIEMSKLDAGLVEALKADFAVAPMMARLAAEFAPLCRAEGLSLRVVPSSARVNGDATLLQRILKHLLANAVRFTKSGKVLLGCRRQGGMLRFEVRDSGIGIPAAEFGNIFREFYQVGDPGRERRQGLGLGLTIAGRLAGVIGSRIQVDSLEGRGSRFAVEVPLAGAAARPAQMSLGLSRAGATVMVIDDEPEVLESLRMLLDGWGYRVVPASGAAECARAVDALGRAPDIIVADFRLHDGETGGEAIARVEARSGGGRRIPAIILTGDTAPERLRQARACGHVLLHKPVQAAALRAAIDDALTRAPNSPRKKPKAERLTA